MKRLAISALLSFMTLLGSETRAGVIFTDWTTVDTVNNKAFGSLGPVAVTFTGSRISFGVTDGTFTGFNQPFFSPPLPNSDTVEFQGGPSPFTYTIAFGAPVQDPILELASMGSTLTFPGIALTRLSGQAAFIVAGDTVSWGGVSTLPPPNNDSNGTVQLGGSFSSVTFTAEYAGVDGIALQIGAAAIPEPGTTALLGTGLVGLLGYAWRRRKPGLTSQCT